MKLREGDLEFDFDDQFWNHVIKFDDHPDYTKVKNLVPQTRGVEFTGILSESTFVAIELKDFRGNKTQENNREEPLEIEVAKKWSAHWLPPVPVAELQIVMKYFGKRTMS